MRGFGCFWGISNFYYDWIVVASMEIWQNMTLEVQEDCWMRKGKINKGIGIMSSIPMSLYCCIERKEMMFIYNSFNRFTSFSIGEKGIPIRTVSVIVAIKEIRVIEFNYHCIKVCNCGAGGGGNI